MLLIGSTKSLAIPVCAVKVLQVEEDLRTNNFSDVLHENSKGMYQRL